MLGRHQGDAPRSCLEIWASLHLQRPRANWAGLAVPTGTSTALFKCELINFGCGRTSSQMWSWKSKIIRTSSVSRPGEEGRTEWWGDVYGTGSESEEKLSCATGMHGTWAHQGELLATPKHSHRRSNQHLCLIQRTCPHAASSFHPFFPTVWPPHKSHKWSSKVDIHIQQPEVINPWNWSTTVTATA